MSDTGDTITITGNVATEPEFKRTPAGLAITTFRVASGRRRFDRESGTWSESGTNWYTVSVFRALADHAHASLRKGDRVILTGRLRLREWDNGARRGTAVEIDAEAIGHDLLWGTTTFAKDPRLVSGGSDGRSTSDATSTWSAPATDTDGWSAPGVGSGDQVHSDARADGTGEHGQRELVATSPSQEASETPAEVPF